MEWFLYIAGILILMFFIVLGWWQATKDRGPNDAVSVLHVTTITWTFVVLIFSILASVGYEWADPIFLMSVVGIYVIVDAMYSLVATLADRHKLRFIQNEKKESPYYRIGKRYGQHIGAAFIIICLTLTVLAALNVPAPLGAGHFTEVSQATFVAIDATVIIIAVASAAKAIANRRSREMQNTILMRVTIYASVVYGVLLVIHATGGPEVPSDYPWTFAAILGSYTAHNVALTIWSKKLDQKRYGHLVGLFFMAVFGPIIVFSYGFSVAPVFPHLLIAFVAFNAVIMSLGGSSRYGLEEWRERIRKHAHNREKHPYKNARECKICQVDDFDIETEQH